MLPNTVWLPQVFQLSAFSSTIILTGLRCHWDGRAACDVTRSIVLAWTVQDRLKIHIRCFRSDLFSHTWANGHAAGGRSFWTQGPWCWCQSLSAHYKGTTGSVSMPAGSPTERVSHILHLGLCHQWAPGPTCELMKRNAYLTQRNAFIFYQHV